MKPATLLVSTSLLALAIGLGAYRGVKADSDDAGADADSTVPSLVSVQVGALRRMTVHRYLDGYGVIAPAPATPREPAASATLASPVSGVVTRVRVAAGERVRRGQVLVELNSDSMTERYAEQEVARQRRLYAEHNTSLKALQNAEARLALLRVAAPLAGTVVRVGVGPGAAVNTSTVLAEVVDLKRLVVRTDIPQEQAAQLKVGQRVEFFGAAPSAQLGYISPTVDAQDGAVMAWAKLRADSGLRPGQFVRLRIVTATHPDSLVAPAASVVSDLSGHSVLSLVRGEEAVRTRVKSGLREDGWVEVSGPGLEPGTKVVTVGAYGLPERTRIQIVHPPREPAASSNETPPTR